MCIYKTDDGKCKKFSDDKTTSYCVNAPCEHEKLSNYDRIRNMSIEEMADFIATHGAEYNMYLSLNGFLYCTKEVATQKNIEWLLQEVEENERKID